MLEKKDNLLQRIAKVPASQICLVLDTVDGIFTRGPITATLGLVGQELSEVGYLLTGNKNLSYIEEVKDRMQREFNARMQ